MNEHDISQMDDLSKLAKASVRRALDARQELASLDIAQAALVGGGLPPAATDIGRPTPPTWFGIWSPAPKQAMLI